MTFYIPDFACGVIVTVIVEVFAILIYAVYRVKKDERKDESNE